MLIKEYRIALPMSVEEYRIAQLYMIQRKSREESEGTESGIEILVNEPYTDGPGGSGQFTHKIYHIGNHLPGWFQAILPKSALIVEEEAWNAYPYTRTVYRCPFVQKFSLDIETRYYDDAGQRDNVFSLTASDLRNRVLDKIDIVNDVISTADYKAEEDPLVFVSTKTGRGPLNKQWLDNGGGSGEVMCAYKLCKVEFRYWGMQNKIERFIHDIGLRKTMLRAHRQAWCWQDEYDGLTIEDIRLLEADTQRALQIKMAPSQNVDNQNENKESVTPTRESPMTTRRTKTLKESESMDSRRDSWFSVQSYQPGSGASVFGSAGLEEHLFEISSESEEDDESFYDAEDQIASESFSNSMENIGEPDNNPDTTSPTVDAATTATPPGANLFQTNDCYLIILLQGDTICGDEHDTTGRSLQDSFSYVLNTGHYDQLNAKSVEFLTLRVTSFCRDTNALYHSLRTDESARTDQYLTSIPAIITSSHTDLYQKNLCSTTADLNALYRTYAAKHKNAKIHISIVADRLGSIIIYDILSKCNSLEESISVGDNLHLDIDNNFLMASNPKSLHRNVSCPPSIQHPVDESSSASSSTNHLAFCVDDVFTFQSPLSYVLVHRLSISNASTEFSAVNFSTEFNVLKPLSCNFYNIYYSADPSSLRLEPLIYDTFNNIPAFPISIFSKFPLGRSGQSIDIDDTIYDKQHELLDPSRRDSCASIVSGYKNYAYSDLLTNVQCKWWGKKRIDYYLENTYDRDKYIQKPESTHIVIYNSFYENHDVAAFMIRQIIGPVLKNKIFQPTHPMEKWQKRSNRGIQNKSSNHKANDVFILQNEPIKIPAKFAYGVLGRNVLKGEFVDIYYKVSHDSEWVELGQTITDQSGRVIYEIMDKLQIGIYPILMVVRGDHTMLEMKLIIVPANMPVAVFSIDGSFALNFSISGRDPKIRTSSMELVDYWKSLGYFILYVTARPEIQRKKVNKWFQQHGFPRSTMNFTDSISIIDPCRQKTSNLQDIINNGNIKIHAAYGSNKDIPVYQSIGVLDSNIYIISKSKPKINSINHILDTSAVGYSEHLHALRKARPVDKIRLCASLDYSRYCSNKDNVQLRFNKKQPVGKALSLPIDSGDGSMGPGAGQAMTSKHKRWSRKNK